MLDAFVVFSKHGLVLFRRDLAKLKGDPVDKLIRTVLLETRETTANAFEAGPHALKYRLENRHGLVFVAIFQSLLKPAYVDDLLQSVAKAFCKVYGDELADASGPLDFGARFDKLLWAAEEAARRPRRRKPAAGGSNPADTGSDGEDEEESEAAAAAAVGEEGSDGTDPADGEDALSNMVSSLEQRRARAAKGPRAFQGKKGQQKSGKESKKGGKEMRSWDGQNKLSAEEEAALDASGKGGGSPEASLEADMERAKKYLPEHEGEKADLDKSDDEDDDGDDGGSWNFSKTAIGSFFAGLAGQKPLTREELAPAVENMEKQLLAKNVSTETAREIAEAVALDLEGKKLGSFTKGVAQAVRESCHAALQRLLTPKRSTDILREAKAAKAAGRPYTVVFIGVNGVGKSTSLSKVCYYLKQNGLKVLLCACDTFRSGAVEQLKVHQRNLGVDLFEQGYNKDAASVATQGIKYAKENGFDVVLVDTAGRMQNNEPLMRALTKLIARNRPDLVLFVGEALVGNDGRDQLVHFDKALVDYSDSADPRRIDGMILTKFDTIDDKVGAAVSMVHSTGQPIIFVGTGQKYTNLNKINVSKVVRALLD